MWHGHTDSRKPRQDLKLGLSGSRASDSTASLHSPSGAPCLPQGAVIESMDSSTEGPCVGPLSYLLVV